MILKNKRDTIKQDSEVVTDVGKEVVRSLATLENDYELTRQDGKKVKLSELDGKVWVAAQFFAACPMCAKRNAEGAS